MSYGLNVRNENDEMIVDQDYANYALWASGTITQALGTFGTPWNFPALAAEPPLLFLSSPTRFVACPGYAMSGANFAGVYLIWEDGGNSGSAGLSVDYRLYLPASSRGASGDGYGLRVFRSDGSIAFDAGYDYLKIAAMAAPARSSGMQTYTHGIAGTVYCCINPFSGVYPQMVSPGPPAPTYTMIGYGIKSISGAVQFGRFDSANWQTGGAPNAPNSNTVAPLIFVQ